MRETAAAQALLAMWIGLEGRAGGPGKDPEFKLHDDAAQGNRGDDRNISRRGKCQSGKRIASRTETSVFETGRSTSIDLGPVRKRSMVINMNSRPQCINDAKIP